MGALDIITVFSLVLAGIATLVILYDIFVAGHRPKTVVMEVVWPVSALYFGR